MTTIKFATLDQFTPTWTEREEVARVRDAEREAELALTRCNELQLQEWLARAPHDVLWLAREVKMLRAKLEEATNEADMWMRRANRLEDKIDAAERLLSAQGGNR